MDRTNVTKWDLINVPFETKVESLYRSLSNAHAGMMLTDVEKYKILKERRNQGSFIFFLLHVFRFNHATII